MTDEKLHQRKRANLHKDEVKPLPKLEARDLLTFSNESPTSLLSDLKSQSQLHLKLPLITPKEVRTSMPALHSRNHTSLPKAPSAI